MSFWNIRRQPVHGKRMVSPVRGLAWLAWIARMVGPTNIVGTAASLPRSAFHCRLDDQPDHLVPMRILEQGLWEGLADRRRFLNPLCTISSSGFPEFAAGEDFSAFGLRGPTAWLTDPATHALQPFWLSSDLADALYDLQPGDPLPSSFSLRLQGTLAMANVLVDDAFGTTRCHNWAETVSRCHEQFRTRGFAPVRDLIHPFHISALRRYYRQLIRTGKLPLGDGQTPQRYVAHNESVARFFHRQLTNAISQLAGEPLKPSYVYMGSYQSGATLERHTDREQCEFSLTLCVDYSPEPHRATPWPLILHTDNGDIRVFQSIGDALLYKGRELPHSRTALPLGHTSTSIFFHYVRKHYAGPLD
jgi:hypothetical protein